MGTINCNAITSATHSSNNASSSFNSMFAQKSYSTSDDTGFRSHGKLWSNLREVCDLLQIELPQASSSEEIQFQHLRFKAGQRIHSIGQHFDTLYIVHSGFLKRVLIDEFGNEQVLSFPMKGDLLGIDGIHAQHHVSEAVALSDCDVILLPYKAFSNLGHTYAELEQAMLSVMSRELVREQIMIAMLSALSAETKVARFLTTLGERFSALGYSGKSFNLRMTRQEIGSYLGLTLETVSRTLSAFNEMGFISVDQRQISLLDVASLKNMRRLPSTKTRSKTSDKVREKVNALVSKNLIPQWNNEMAAA
jgi:CRP/FNR family transcriptional regulator, anaerobic regulatory protein